MRIRTSILSKDNTELSSAANNNSKIKRLLQVYSYLPPTGNLQWFLLIQQNCHLRMFFDAIQLHQVINIFCITFYIFFSWPSSIQTNWPPIPLFQHLYHNLHFLIHISYLSCLYDIFHSLISVFIPPYLITYFAGHYPTNHFLLGLCCYQQLYHYKATAMVGLVAMVEKFGTDASLVLVGFPHKLWEWHTLFQWCNNICWCHWGERSLNGLTKMTMHGLLGQQKWECWCSIQVLDGLNYQKNAVLTALVQLTGSKSLVEGGLLDMTTGQISCLIHVMLRFDMME